MSNQSNPITNVRIVVAVLFIAVGILSLAIALKLDHAVHHAAGFGG